MHVNLPFADDSQFARLHAAIRLVLPLLPALAASSPIAEGSVMEVLDFRLDAYYAICALTPRVAGDVIPETVESRAEYEARILAPMYDEIAPLDPAGVLRHEWLNSRGAIPQVRSRRDRDPAHRRAGVSAGRFVDRGCRDRRDRVAVRGAIGAARRTAGAGDVSARRRAARNDP